MAMSDVQKDVVAVFGEPREKLDKLLDFQEEGKGRRSCPPQSIMCVEEKDKTPSRSSQRRPHANLSHSGVKSDAKRPPSSEISQSPNRRRRTKCRSESSPAQSPQQSPDNDENEDVNMVPVKVEDSAEKEETLVDVFRRISPTQKCDLLFNVKMFDNPIMMANFAKKYKPCRGSFFQYLIASCEAHEAALLSFANDLHAGQKDTEMKVKSQVWESALKKHDIDAAAVELPDLKFLVDMLRRVLPAQSRVPGDELRVRFSKELYNPNTPGLMQQLSSLVHASCCCAFQLLNVGDHPQREQVFKSIEELFFAVSELLGFEILALTGQRGPDCKPVVDALRKRSDLLLLDSFTRVDKRKSEGEIKGMSASDNGMAATSQASDSSAVADGVGSGDPAGAGPIVKFSGGNPADKSTCIGPAGLRGPYDPQNIRLPRFTLVLIVLLRLLSSKVSTNFRHTTTSFLYVALCMKRRERYHRSFGIDLWKRVDAVGSECVDTIVQVPEFWNAYVPLMLKKARNGTAFAVLVSLFWCESSFVRMSHDSSRTEVKDALLIFVIDVFSGFAKDPLRALSIHNEEMKILGYMKNQFALELLFVAVFKHSLYIREVFFGRFMKGDAFGGVIETLWMQVSRLFDSPASPADAIEHARFILPAEIEDEQASDADEQPASLSAGGITTRSNRGSKQGVGKRVTVSSGGTDDDSEKDQEATRVREVRLVCFVAKFVGFWGKSFTDGSWDPSHPCLLSEMFKSAKWNGRRQLGALYRRLEDVRKSLDSGYTAEDGKVEVKLVSVDDCNHFMYVREAVRRQLLLGAEERDGRGVDVGDKPLGKSKTSEPRGSKRVSAAGANFSVLPVKMKWAATSKDVAWADFESQSDILQALSENALESGNDGLSRFDPTCAVAAKYNKLKRNKYLAVKPRLRPVDKCTCLGTAVTKHGLGSGSKIACSNNMCENRGQLIECDPASCPVGAKCQNQRLQKQDYAPSELVVLGDKGSGLSASKLIPRDSLIGEYQGEIVDGDEFMKRRAEYLGERHFYFMKLSTGLFIDASRAAQVTRFINHSCEPNAETQKWVAGRENRVAIVAKRDIQQGEEITFDYGTEEGTVDERPVKCTCGAKSCRGFLVRVSKKPKTEELKSVDSTADKPVAEDSFIVREAEIRKTRIEQAKRHLQRSKELSALLKSWDLKTVPPYRTRDPSEGVEAVRLGEFVDWKSLLETGRSPAVVEDSFRIPKKLNEPSCQVLVKDEKVVEKLPRSLPKTPESFTGRTNLRDRFGGTGAGMPSLQKPFPRVRKSIFAPVADSSSRKRRRDEAHRAPPLRNRRCIRAQRPIDSDSDSSCSEYSLSSLTLPAGDDAVFVPDAVSPNGHGDSAASSSAAVAYYPSSARGKHRA